MLNETSDELLTAAVCEAAEVCVAVCAVLTHTPVALDFNVRSSVLKRKTPGHASHLSAVCVCVCGTVYMI